MVLRLIHFLCVCVRKEGCNDRFEVGGRGVGGRITFFPLLVACKHGPKGTKEEESMVHRRKKEEEKKKPCQGRLVVVGVGGSCLVTSIIA